MRIKKQPCAYCATKHFPREVGHVIPDCMYPTNMDPKIQRRTVPECIQCKTIWQDAENQFRNLTVIPSYDKAPPAIEQWRGPIRRSFKKDSGERWFNDIVEQLVPVQTDDGIQVMLFPSEDSRVNLVVRKIVRGLCHYHKLGTAIADRRVVVDSHRETIPPGFYARFVEFDLGEDFCQYAFCDMRTDACKFHSVWVFCFYGHCKFVGFVSTSEEGFSIPISEPA
jgi:hypothetical protein